MKKSIIKQLNTSIMISNIPIQIGVKKHFNTIETKVLIPKNYTDDLFEEDVDYYMNYTELTKKERGYSLKLAFFQRIQLKLDDTFTSPVNYNNYPIHLLENFTKTDELFEKHFDSFDKERSRLPEYRSNFKKKVVNTIFKFWLCGYGILPGYTFKTIGNDEINFLFHRIKGTKKLSKFLSSMLITEKSSPISIIPLTSERISICESEKIKWTDLLKTNNCEIGQQLFNFVFDVLKCRAEGNYLLTYYDKNGLKRRVAYNSIRWGSFRAYSSSLLKFVRLMFKNGYHSIEQSISGGIIDVLTSDSYRDLNINDKNNIKTSLRFWLDCYSKINCLELNINRIIPMTVSNRDTTFGKIFDFGSAHALISTLLDDHSDAFDENKLFDLRARRACLIELDTGKRISEILLLKRECLKTDHEGNIWIHFHKTKNGLPQTLPATKNVVRWVQQLKNMSAPNKIFVSSQEDYFGDDETDYRLFANIHNDGIMGVGSINRFLKNIQQSLWSNIESSKYYSSHDLRKISAVYMKMKGASKEDIQEQLNQIDIDSQLPYLETKPPEIQKHFKDIANKGLWSHLTDVVESSEPIDDKVSIEQVLHRSERQGMTLNTKDSAQKFLQEAMSRVEKQQRKLPNNIGKENVSTGFPIRTHNCLATEVVNCGHTELHCFSCKRYMPDSDKLEEHKAEVFRYILLLAHNDDKAKKSTLEKDIIVLRSKNIEDLLKVTFKNLFRKFDLESSEVNNLKKELYSKAKKYYRKHKKDKPTLSFQEALKFLKKGVIDGK